MFCFLLVLGTLLVGLKWLASSEAYSIKYSLLLRSSRLKSRMSSCCLLLQSALEVASESAMAAAMERMNRAVELVAEAESKAATAAAMATAYQDISEHQAEIAAKAADIPAPIAAPSGAGIKGRVADIHVLLHNKLFSVGNLLQEWVAGMWAGVLALLLQCRDGVVAAWAGVVAAFSKAWGAVAKPF